MTFALTEGLYQTGLGRLIQSNRAPTPQPDQQQIITKNNNNKLMLLVTHTLSNHAYNSSMDLETCIKLRKNSVCLSYAYIFAITMQIS